MQRVHVIGGKNHGKTTLVVELVQHFRAHGLRVATIKHTHHQHELDSPGKDTHRHREAGAVAVGILTRSMHAVFWPPADASEADGDRYQCFQPLFTDCDLVLVEGDQHTQAFKIEVWRAAVGTQPLAAADRSIAAIVTDDSVQVTTPVWRRADIESVAQSILAGGDRTRWPA